MLACSLSPGARLFFLISHRRAKMAGEEVMNVGQERWIKSGVLPGALYVYKSIIPSTETTFSTTREPSGMITSFSIIERSIVTPRPT
jgi:hypothetical protein